ncbi:hypothetical protein MATL_G00223140 [Megalops atlanticus]|uniref:Uncharacterized protein n=1 Tax=Megalops atlanticus TaxID=7932 RepID=A0A9D3SWD7_MEGAT|nr:hypothetical protein MATL_G00223140 [Megalops atlanticus]
MSSDGEEHGRRQGERSLGFRSVNTSRSENTESAGRSAGQLTAKERGQLKGIRCCCQTTKTEACPVRFIQLLEQALGLPFLGSARFPQRPSSR